MIEIKGESKRINHVSNTFSRWEKMLKLNIKCDAQECKNSVEYDSTSMNYYELPKGWTRIYLEDLENEKIPNQKIGNTYVGAHACSKSCALKLVLLAFESNVSIFNISFNHG